MAIEYPISIPDDLFAQLTFSEVNTVALNVSPFTGKRHKQIFQGQFWRVVASWVQMNREEGEDVGGTLSALYGTEGTCTIPDPLNSQPRGEAKTDPGTPTVNGGGQTGKVLSVKDAPVEVENYLVRGDRIQIGPIERPRLYKVLENVSTSVAGTFDVSVWPILKTPIIDDDPIFLFNPRGLFEMEDNSLEYAESLGGIYTYRVSFVEAIS